MNLDHVTAIARAVLYEGYILYPYRPSSLKNQQRWVFGAVFPRDYAAAGGSDPSSMQTQCLVRGMPDARLSVRVRFLHLVRRDIGTAEGNPASVTIQHVADQLLVAWDEAVEREVVIPPATLATLSPQAAQIPIAIPPHRQIEPVRDDTGQVAATFIRTAAALSGTITVYAEPVGENIHRLTVRIENTTLLPLDQPLLRDAAQRYAFGSAHTVLGIEGSAFVSLTDPPPALQAQAAACQNQGTWPVLIGDDGAPDTVLSSPIILPDYPRIAPESPGDLFDGCEIDEILTLRILTMTDQEKREMAATDLRARALLDRTESLTPAELERLHGTRRPSSMPRLATLVAHGVRLSIGDQVRLRPRRRADIMDIVLDGMIAIIEAIERDFEDNVHLAVTIADDPGRDLGADRYPGHRFFFSVDEVEPIGADAVP